MARGRRSRRRFIFANFCCARRILREQTVSRSLSVLLAIKLAQECKIACQAVKLGRSASSIGEKPMSVILNAGIVMTASLRPSAVVSIPAMPVSPPRSSDGAQRPLVFAHFDRNICPQRITGSARNFAEEQPAGSVVVSLFLHSVK